MYIRLLGSRLWCIILDKQQLQQHYLQVMVWKTNFDSADCSDGVRLQDKTTSSSQAPQASTTAYPPFNSHPSLLRSQVSSDSCRQWQSQLLLHNLLSVQSHTTYPFISQTHPTLTCTHYCWHRLISLFLHNAQTPFFRFFGKLWFHCEIMYNRAAANHYFH